MACDNAGTQAVLETLRATVPQLSLTMAQLELKNAFRQFCTDTGGWFEFYETDLVAGEREYPIGSPDPRGDISKIISVAVDGRPVPGWSGTYLPQTAEGTAGFLTNPDQLVTRQITGIKLGSIYLSGDTLQVGLTLRPKVAAAADLYIPDMIAEEFFDVILAGTLARIYAHPNRPYTDKETARMQKRMYSSHIGDVRRQTQARYTRQPVPWAFPQQAPGGRAR